MNKTPLLTLLLTLCLTTGLAAQNPGDKLFDPTVLHEIDMTFAEPNYWELLEENFGDAFDPASSVSYLMAAVTIDGETVDSVGIRFKGFTSAWTETKKPFKIDFNEFVPGKRYNGLRKLNLNNGTGDPGLQRDVICYDLMNRSGVSAPRTAFARVSINGEFFAVYQLIEQIDKVFLGNHFGNATGNLFKNKGWFNFENDGSYRVMELKTNEEEDDYSGLLRLVKVLNGASEEEFPAAIEEIFNVDRYLKTLAVDVATDNWDSNLEHGRNWYMYEDPATGKFQWIPWDYNFALNSNFFGGGCFVQPQPVGHTDGTTTVEFYDNGFFEGGEAEFLWEFGDGNTAVGRRPVHIYADSAEYEVCLTVTVEDCVETRCIFVDTGKTLANCSVVLNGDFPREPDLAFTILIQLLSECCDEWGGTCQEFYTVIQDDILNPDDGGDGGGAFGRNFAVDQRGTDRLLINRLLAVPDFYDRYLDHFCSLVDNVFLPERYDAMIAANRALLESAMQESPNELSPFSAFEREMGPAGISKLIADRAENLEGQLSELGGCNEPPAAGIPFGDVVINEFVADNDSTSTIADPDGGYPDWIELYNNTDAPINLSGVHLSDKPDNLDKWSFPDGTTIAAGGYLIVWADEDEDQRGLHANFKLSKGGEAIYLSNAGDSTRIDEVVFGPRETNVSTARVPNGTGDFVASHTTHGFSNDTPVSARNLAEELALTVFPNPAGDFLSVRFPGAAAGAVLVEVYDLTGRQLLSGRSAAGQRLELSVSSLVPGFYFLNVRNAGGRTGTVKFAKR